MKRKLLTILLTIIATLCLCLAFAACDGNGGNTGSGSDTEQGNTQKPDGGGDKDPDDGEENPEHIHTFTDYVYNNDATCTEDGTETATCTCGETDTRTKKNSSLGHKFETYTPNNDATCTKNGTETATCSRCSEQDTREAQNSALGHAMESVQAKEPTCTENGWDAYQECSRCHERENYVEKEALGHTITETYTPKQCNGRAKASVHRSCSKCEFKEDETIEDISALIYRSAFSVINGRVTSADYTAQFVEGGYGKLSYKWEIFSSETSATPTKVLEFSENNVLQLSNFMGLNGQVIQVTIKDDCSNYSIFRVVVREEEMPGLSDRTEPIEIFEGEHSYQSVKTDPTCTEQGYTTYTCTACGDHYVDDYTDPLGHEYQKDVCIRCSQHTGLLYVQSGDHYVLIGLGTCTEKKIVIAEEYEGLPVTEIGNGAFRGQDSILSVQIPYGITKIGEYAFYNCYGLTEITIPDSVTEMGNNVFSLCRALKNITIPASTESIGDSAFSNSGLKEVIFAPDSQLKSIGSYAFYGCDFTAFTVPKGVISIGQKAFYGCDDLVSVTFEEPNGWKLSNSQALDATQLQTPAIAAAFLSKTYCDLTWTRSADEA